MPTLLIAEKPKAAGRIAEALGDPTEKKKGKTVWYELGNGQDKLYVTPAVGHIFSLKQKGKGWDYPVFDMEWIPSFEADDDASFMKPYFRNMERIAEKCDDFVIGTDYDTEGSVIGYNILRHICDTEDGRRMRFSTLTDDEIRDAYIEAGELDREQIEAGLARHELDWLFGINISRALTKAVNRDSSGFTILSTGRVQGPALRILAEREREIEEFEPEPYWKLEADVVTEEGTVTAEYEEDKIWDEEEAEEIKDGCGNIALVDAVNKRTYNKKPFPPFDLTSLQTEAHHTFGYSPSDTLSLAQSLYDEGLISYPRTSSQKLPEKLGLDGIVASLADQKEYEELVSRLPRPLEAREGKKKDQAHPAIHPTGAKPDDLNSRQKKLYDLIVRRFLACFADPATRESMKMELDVSGHAFEMSGVRTVDPQWISIYKYANFSQDELPSLSEGDELDVSEVRMLDKETRPPNRYTQASLVKELERRGLGTKATRSEVVGTLYDRDYIDGKSIEVTQLGLGVVDTLEEYVPDILSEELTREFEEDMESIMEGEHHKEDFIEEAKETLGTILAEFQDNEEAIGEQLEETLRETRREQKRVGECGECGEHLRIIRSKSSGKRFIGCEGYPDCENGYPLPQSGGVKTTDKTCDTCGMPIVMILKKGKRPWFLCIDPDCPSKDDWGKDKGPEGIQKIKGIGKKTAGMLEDAGYDTEDALANAEPGELEEVDGIGQATAEKIIERAKSHI